MLSEYKQAFLIKLLNLAQGKEISKSIVNCPKKCTGSGRFYSCRFWRISRNALTHVDHVPKMHLSTWIILVSSVPRTDKQADFRVWELRQEKFNENLRKRRKSKFNRPVLLLSKQRKANDDWFLCQIGSFCVDRLVARGLRGHIVELCRRLLYHWYPTSLLSQLGRANWDWKNIGSR